MWSLSIPQVAATLAAALAPTTQTRDERLIGEPVLNSVIVLLVVTSVQADPHRRLPRGCQCRSSRPCPTSLADKVVVPAVQRHALL
jgi:hypothetical protein